MALMSACVRVRRSATLRVAHVAVSGTGATGYEIGAWATRVSHLRASQRRR